MDADHRSARSSECQILILKEEDDLRGRLLFVRSSLEHSTFLELSLADRKAKNVLEDYFNNIQQNRS